MPDSTEIFEIIPGVYQSAHLTAMPKYIDASLNLDTKSALYKTEHLKGYTHLPILDGPNPGQEWLKNALKILEDYRKQGFNVCIHCRGGVSRSVFVTAALLIKEIGLKPSEAVTLIDSKSHHADPAPAFILALREFADQLKV